MASIEHMWGLYQRFSDGMVRFTGKVCWHRRDVIKNALDDWQLWDYHTRKYQRETWPQLKRRYGLFVARVAVAPEVDDGE